MHPFKNFLFILVFTWAGLAAANVKPKILIVFDTSGSMLQDANNNWQTGDGSTLCQSRGNQSRIYQLKTALFDVLQGMGAEEVDFALATFPMFIDPSRQPFCPLGSLNTCNNNNPCTLPGETCNWVMVGGKYVRACVSTCQSTPSCSGHYFTGAGTLSEIPSFNSCKSADGSDCRYGCKISTHNPNNQTNANCGDKSNPCSAWYSKLSEEVLKVSFAGTAPEKVMRYFDELEDTDAAPPLQNPEIRAGNGWWTPLGKTLFYAYGYFHKEIIPNIPAHEKPCQNLVIAFFTDGAETCNMNTSDAFYPPKWAKNLYDNLKVVTHTVAIDDKSPLLQDIATAGKGSYHDVHGTTSELKAAFLDIIAQSLPPHEVCNGIDDDCDQLADEDFPLKGKPCNNGELGECYKTGIYVCKNDQTGVVCNAGAGQKKTEICDGKDNDCDGAIDEDIPGGCIPCVAQPEICNKKDDDCDGKIDEDIPSQPCGVDIGECKPGKIKCVDGKLICDGGTAPKAEECNGLDDDCDTFRDGMTRECYDFPSGCEKLKDGSWDCKGMCKPGIQTCNAVNDNGTWKGVWENQCSGAIGPSTEVCDGFDNDCDGQKDEEAICPGGGQCIEGQCSRRCGSGEFDCPLGQLCINGWCLKDPCDPEECGKQGWVCKSGQCTDPCKGASCGKYEICKGGACIDQSCYNPQNPCPAGKTCIQGQCLADPCANVSCSENEFCLDGHCQALCDSHTCPQGEQCTLNEENGTKSVQCMPDPCWGVQCKSGFACKNGQCEVDPCNAVFCDTGLVCKNGTCVADICEKVTCPMYYTCNAGSCIPSDTVRTSELFASGNGGCSCSIGSEEPPPFSLDLILFWVGCIFFVLRLKNRRS